MNALQIVTPLSDDGWLPPVCNCRVSLVDENGQVRSIRSQRWDCPSCGLDKAKKIREMCVAAAADRMLVGTFEQPEYVLGETPVGYSECIVATHVYVHSTGRKLWRRLEMCPHCCRASSRTQNRFLRALRKIWPEVEYMPIREIKPKSGAFDINLAVTGLPWVTRSNAEGKLVKQAWKDAGGGFLDLGDDHHRAARVRSAGGVGNYIGKYLTKLAHRPLAKGFRRYSRSRGFAPEVKMTTPRDPNVVPEHTYTFLGFEHPDRVPHKFAPVQPSYVNPDWPKPT